MTVVRSRYNPIIVRVATAVIGVIVAILALHIVFVLLGANTENPLVTLTGNLAGWFGWLFTDLFLLGNAKLRALLNYGIAIGVYAAIGLTLRSALRGP